MTQSKVSDAFCAKETQWLTLWGLRVRKEWILAPDLLRFECVTLAICITFLCLSVLFSKVSNGNRLFLMISVRTIGETKVFL